MSIHWCIIYGGFHITIAAVTVWPAEPKVFIIGLIVDQVC